MAIPFQYLRPDGRMLSVTVERPIDVAKLAARLTERLKGGVVFECEEMVNGDVVLFARRVDDPDHHLDISAAVARLVREAAAGGK